jgi:hypothetical protein
MRASSVFATQQHSSSNPVPSVQVQAAHQRRCSLDKMVSARELCTLQELFELDRERSFEVC